MKLNKSVKSGTGRAVRHVWQMRRTSVLNWPGHIHVVQAWVWIEQRFSGIDMETGISAVGKERVMGIFNLFIVCYELN